MNRLVLILLPITIITILPAGNATNSQQAPAGWAAFEYLLGDWVGEGGGQPGQGAGEFSFHPDLQNHILVRKSYAVYPPRKDLPGFRHDDLMVVYREANNAPPKALYMDSEGHVIHYSVTTSADKKTIEFLSDVLPASPRYRLTYFMTGSDALILKFEIATPGKPDSFSTYIEAKARRK